MIIYYITRMNFRSNKAHVYNTARTCEALQKTGQAHVRLVSSDDSMLSDAARDEYFAANGVEQRFEVISLNSPSRAFSKSRLRLFNYIEVILANISLTRFVIARRHDIGVVYFRDPLVALPIFVAHLLKKPIFFEAHAVLVKKSTQRMGDYLARISSGVISISKGLESYYGKLNAHSTMSFCAAAEPERFAAVHESKADLRRRLGYPENAVVLGYSGNLYRTGNNDPYGLDDIIRALPHLDNNVVFIGVGKKGNETAELEALAESLKIKDRVLFLPWVPKDTIAEYLLASDILVIPAAGARIGNSPTKMFEYLVSGRPIIAANTEAIREVLANGRNALLVDYTKPEDWAFAVRKLLAERPLSDRIVKQAMEDGMHFSWADRGKDIISFIKASLNIHA